MEAPRPRDIEVKDLAFVPIQMLELYKDEIISKGFMTKEEYANGVDELHN